MWKLSLLHNLKQTDTTRPIQPTLDNKEYNLEYVNNALYIIIINNIGHNAKLRQLSKE